MGLLKKSIVAIVLVVFFTCVFAVFNSLGIMNAKIGSELYFLIFFTWVLLEVIFSTM